MTPTSNNIKSVWVSYNYCLKNFFEINTIQSFDRKYSIFYGNNEIVVFYIFNRVYNIYTVLCIIVSRVIINIIQITIMHEYIL